MSQIPEAQGRYPGEIYRELADETDWETVRLVTRAVLQMRQAVKDEAMNNRVVEIGAIRGYLRDAADRNGGSIPIAEAEAILDAVMAADK